MVLQHFVDLLLDLGGQTVEISRPGVAATGALQRDDGEALYEEHAADVLTIRALNREGEIGVATIHRPSTNQWRAPDTTNVAAGAATRGRAVNAESPDDAPVPGHDEASRRASQYRMRLPSGAQHAPSENSRADDSVLQISPGGKSRCRVLTRRSHP
jgi:hypothetical protein